jgi:hypothetical protein
MESICDAPFPAVSRQNKIEHLSLGTPFEIAKREKDAESKQPIFNPASKRIYATFSRISGANGKHNAICILRSNRSSCETVRNFQKAELTEHPPEAIAFL